MILIQITAGDRGDALEQCAMFVLGAMAIYWCCFMDHGDDGVPGPAGLDKWWKRSEVRAYNRGHAARTDPGIMLALRTHAIQRIAVGLDLPLEWLGSLPAAPVTPGYPPADTMLSVLEQRRYLLDRYGPPAGERVTLDIGIVRDSTLNRTTLEDIT